MIFKPKQLDSDIVKTFSETEIGVILENIDEKLDLILESQSGMRSDIKEIKSNYKHIDDRIGKTEIRLDVVEAR